MKINKVRKFRKEMNLTQEALAEKVEVHRNTIISIESGKHTPKLVLAYKISLALNVSIYDLFPIEQREK